ncbi:MAG TPA: serine hydrolase domain-containing protein, partial [Anditalea sp.]|nr:serine hydrolase domain-containing protein [Anditalea sp.]
MHRPTVLTMLLIVLSFNINGQDISDKVSPESVSMSSQRLSYIDSILMQAVKKEDIPGAVALVIKDGKTIYSKAFGYADINEETELRTDHIFRIASQTKAITATAVMMLWEEGRFKLDDPISKWIPEFKNPVVLKELDESDTSFTAYPANKEITIRHLLTHTSGLGYGVIDGDDRMKKLYHKASVTDLFTTENITIEESVKNLASMPLHHHPGEKYTYSEGLDVLGYFVEIVSGESFDRFLRERIFDPLGMEDTWFYLPESKANRLLPVHTKENGEWRTLNTTFYDPDYPVRGERKFFSGGAGLSSTAMDYAKLGGIGNEGTFDWGGYFNTQYFADPKTNTIG